MKTQSLVSKKCEYALRAIFELARNYDEDPIKIQDIASAQEIPPRFLEAILVELKNAGFVLSKRGSSGGYILARKARHIEIGEVIRLFHAELCTQTQTEFPVGGRAGDVAFSRLWQRTHAAISDVYDQVTFQDLVQEEMSATHDHMLDYVI